MYASFGQCRIKRTPIALARQLCRQNWFFRHLPCIFRFLIFQLFRQFALSRPAQRKHWRFCRLSLKHKNHRQFQLNADCPTFQIHPRRLCLKPSRRHTRHCQPTAPFGSPPHRCGLSRIQYHNIANECGSVTASSEVNPVYIVVQRHPIIQTALLLRRFVFPSKQ